MAHQIKTVVTKFDDLEFDPRNLPGRRQELSPVRCPLTSTCMLWSAHPHSIPTFVRNQK